LGAPTSSGCAFWEDSTWKLPMTFEVIGFLAGSICRCPRVEIIHFAVRSTSSFMSHMPPPAKSGMMETVEPGGKGSSELRSGPVLSPLINAK
jgi:hypothetical protein